MITSVHLIQCKDLFVIQWCIIETSNLLRHENIYMRFLFGFNTVEFLTITIIQESRILWKQIWVKNIEERNEGITILQKK